MTDPGSARIGPSEPRRSWFAQLDSFAVRLGIIMALALLPVGITGVMQASDLVEAARARSEAALTGETVRLARPYLTRLKMAQGVAAVLSQLDSATCARVVPGLVGSDLLFAGIYGQDGTRLCGAGPAPMDLSPALYAIAPGQGDLRILRFAPGQGLVVLFQRRPDGRDYAIVAPRVPEPVPSQIEGFSLSLRDRRGEVLGLAPAGPSGADLLPEQSPDRALPAAETAIFSARSRAGEARDYAVMPVAEGLQALGSWPEAAALSGADKILPVSVFPLFMWMMSLVAAWAAAETLFAGHVRSLRGAILAFAGGARRLHNLDMQHAPRELRETASAFQSMAVTILQDEARLEDSLRKSETLLREVHHRVKNNLQLILSIVNIQLRRTRSEEVRAALVSLRDRMLGLATIHDRMYQGLDHSDVAMHDLMPGIVDQILRRAGARNRGLRLETCFDPIETPLDMAVPLALLLTEAVSNAVRYADAPPGRAPSLRISFQYACQDEAFDMDQEAGGEAVSGTRQDGRPPGQTEARLQVVNSVVGLPATPVIGTEAGAGISTQLMRGFTRQLSGTFLREFVDEECRVTIWLPLAPRRSEA